MPASTRSGFCGMISSASPWLTGTCAASCETFEFSRASHVTEAMFFGSASRNTSSSTHRFIETIRVGLDAPSAAGAGAAAVDPLADVEQSRRDRQRVGRIPEHLEAALVARPAQQLQPGRGVNRAREGVVAAELDPVGDVDRRERFQTVGESVADVDVLD